MEIVSGDKAIHSEWKEYYEFLENLRLSGVCNMWGANPYIKDAFNLTDEEAKTILCNWIYNYNELNKIYSWR